MSRCERGELIAQAPADTDPVFRRAFEEIEVADGRGLQRVQKGTPQTEADAS
jgi:hypothetical protein